MKKLKDSLKYLKPYDILSIFIFIIMLPISLIYRMYLKIIKKNIWLVTEEGKYARDNGYYFYKYMRENHNEEPCYYVIDKKMKDYKKVEKYGNIIQYRSFKHWLYYMSSNYNISSQKHGNPAQPLFYFVHVILGLYNNRVFLQHGITKDDAKWLYYKNTKFRYFICGAKNEYRFINETFGYPVSNVLYTGFARFDSLHDIKVNKKQILIMPTWRNWLGRETNKLGEKIDFINTEYYKNWNSLLNNQSFIDFIEKENLEVLFYPHINMQKYLKEFQVKSPSIKLVSISSDIQKVLKESAILITDYSSVFMDFAYMKKPIIYFQFDKEEYRKRQYTEGYFKYEKDGFGPVLENDNDIIIYLKKCYHNNFESEEEYLKRMDDFFEINDQDNSKRIYEKIKEIEG